MGGEAVIGHPLSSVFNGRYKNEQTKEQEIGIHPRYSVDALSVSFS